jgi:predicted molibdopterin-dependent oxidoreductase YjgC
LTWTENAIKFLKIFFGHFCTHRKGINMHVVIDGKDVEVLSGDRNIVDLAERAKIKILNPCNKNGEADGCCRSCVVEINGKQKFACSTKPKSGMNIVISRDDLKLLRKTRLHEFREFKKKNKAGPCCSGKSNCCG